VSALRADGARHDDADPRVRALRAALPGWDVSGPLRGGLVYAKPRDDDGRRLRVRFGRADADRWAVFAAPGRPDETIQRDARGLPFGGRNWALALAECAAALVAKERRKRGRPALSPEGKRRRMGPFTLPPDVARRLDDETNKSAAVTTALREYYQRRDGAA